MVRLHTFLLAVTLVTGSALASSNEYQRRSDLDVNNQDQLRVFEQRVVRHRPFRLRFGLACARYFGHHRFANEENLFVHKLDAIDDPEAREPLGRQNPSPFQSRSLEDNEDLFGRDLGAEELFGREYDLLD